MPDSVHAGSMWAAGRHEQPGSPTSLAIPRPHLISRGLRGARLLQKLPSLLLRKAMLSCFLRNVQFLWQNTCSNSHAVQGKWKAFKCGESCSTEGRTHEYAQAAPAPAPAPAPGEHALAGLGCTPSSGSSRLCAQLLSRSSSARAHPAARAQGRAWAGRMRPSRVPPRHVPGGPSQRDSLQPPSFSELMNRLLSPWHAVTRIHPVYVFRGKLLGSKRTGA